MAAPPPAPVLDFLRAQRDSLAEKLEELEATLAATTPELAQSDAVTDAMAAQAGRWAAWADGMAGAWRRWEDGSGGCPAAPGPTPAPSPAQPVACGGQAGPWAAPTTARSLMDRLAAMGAVPALGAAPLPAPCCPRDADRSHTAAGLDEHRERAVSTAGARADAADKASAEIRALGALLRATDDGAAGGDPPSAEKAAPGVALSATAATAIDTSPTRSVAHLAAEMARRRLQG